jgi:protein SCO1
MAIGLPESTRALPNQHFVLFSWLRRYYSAPAIGPVTNPAYTRLIITRLTLPNVTLTDQFGEYVPLASLKGKAALFDFIYKCCPGPCQLLTQHMKLIADRLGPDLGPRVSFVSVTVDPEHDRPTRLINYARALDANVKGWYFLTGSPSQIDAFMRAFQLGRSRDTGGEIDHVLGNFLLSPDGRETVDYSQHVDPVLAARDVEEATSSNTLFGRLRANFRRL